MEEEFCRIPVREDTANPGKIVDEVHDRNLRLTPLLDTYKRTHLHSPYCDQIQYQKRVVADGSEDLAVTLCKRDYVVNDDGIVVADLFVGILGWLR